MRILVTGGCGFIGSNFIKYLLTNPEAGKNLFVINLDKQTYAGQGNNLKHMRLDNHKRYKFIKIDICNKEFVENVISEQKPDVIINFAAESHVDRSIASPEDFIKTNIIGTANLLDAALKNNIKRFVQVSTDEVYGSAYIGSFSENAAFNANSPYSASKAAADSLALSYFRTHNLPVVITRSANNYGPYQFPEKLLPLFITNLIDGKKVPLMWSAENPGMNVRDWLHVYDNCRAIWFVTMMGKNGEVYNIPGENEKRNIDITKDLLKNFGFGERMIERIAHRKGHDFRYSVEGRKLKALGFKYKYKNLDFELKKLIEWYKKNINWWRPLKK